MQMKQIGNNIESKQWTFRIDYPSDAHVSEIINKLYDNKINRRWAYIASVRRYYNNETVATTGIFLNLVVILMIHFLVELLLHLFQIF
jgi:hypothetical protein